MWLTSAYDEVICLPILEMSCGRIEYVEEFFYLYNVGIGKGYSVKEVLDAVRRVTGVDFPVKVGPRRPGDPPQLVANPARIQSELGWQPRFPGIEDIVATAWAWRKAHPQGYAEPGKAA